MKMKTLHILASSILVAAISAFIGIIIINLINYDLSDPSVRSWFSAAVLGSTVGFTSVAYMNKRGSKPKNENTKK